MAVNTVMPFKERSVKLECYNIYGEETMLRAKTWWGGIRVYRKFAGRWGDYWNDNRPVSARISVVLDRFVEASQSPSS